MKFSWGGWRGLCFPALALLAIVPQSGAQVSDSAQNNSAPTTQAETLRFADAHTGIRLLVLPQKAFPVLKVLLPGQAESSRGIEIEFPEHVWGRERATQEVRQLYFLTRPAAAYTWRQEKNAFICQRELRQGVTMIAQAQSERDGVRMRYRFVNHSNSDYEFFQPVTCVKLYDVFADNFLERTYVHHANGFDLIASETPQRVGMPRDRWLPCRYLVSYTWPVVPKERRVEVVEGIPRYNKSRQADQPFLATLSQDGKWIAATCARETGNLWTNPERTCQHADPGTELKPGETREVELKLFLLRGTLDQLLDRVKKERSAPPKPIQRASTAGLPLPTERRSK